MESKRTRRRIIDSTFVPKTRRTNSKSSSQSCNPNVENDRVTVSDDASKTVINVSDSIDDGIAITTHSKECNDSFINDINSKLHSINSVMDGKNDTSHGDCEESKLDCIKSNTIDFMKQVTGDQTKCNLMDISNDSSLFYDNRTRTADENITLCCEFNNGEGERMDDSIFPELSVNDTKDAATKGDELAEIRNEDLIAELGLDEDDNEMCNDFRKFFRPRLSISSIDDYTESFGDTLICRKHPGLFENHRKSSIDNFKFKFESNTNELKQSNINDDRQSNTQDTEQGVNGAYEIQSETVENKDPFLVELELTKSASMEPHISRETMDDLNEKDLFRPCRSSSTLERVALKLDKLDELDEDGEEDVYSAQMGGPDGTPRLLSVEEKWQIIFNEKTRAPIYAVAQYIGYLRQFVSGQERDATKSSDVIKKEGLHPVSYLLRKLKLDLKMSYESFVEEFIKPENNGMSLLVKLLKSIQNTGNQQSGSTNMTQLKNYKKTLTDEHDCLLCIKYSLRLKKALRHLFDINYGLETVAMGVISTFTKSRGTAIEILTLALSTDEGFSRILDCFTYIQLKIGEPVRFKSLINMMNLDSHQNTIFKVSTMKFLNSLLDASPNLNIRVYLQHEIQCAGLDISYIQQKASGTGLEYDDLRRELELWNRRYIDVDSLMSKQSSFTRNVSENSVTIEELQNRVKKLSADKSYLEYQLKSVSKELKKRYEEMQVRHLSQVDKSTQCHRRTARVKNIGCQCVIPAPKTTQDDPMETAARYFGWKDVFVSEEAADTDGADFYRVYECNGSRMGDNESNYSREMITDEEGLVKVKYWLRSNYGSTESDLDANNDGGHKFYFARNSLSRQRVGGSSRTTFPGNWKLIPKSLEQFPSRFPPHQCHQTFCDRCDIRNRPENVGQSRSYVVQSVSLDFNETGDGEGDCVKQTDVKSSQSSDSAIGGSGDRLWNERRIPLLPAVDSEAQILQDLVQPDDSASRCPDTEVEPFPDYSSVGSKYNTQKSYKTELSKVLREFEGELLAYDRPVKSPSESVEHYITLGEV